MIQQQECEERDGGYADERTLMHQTSQCKAAGRRAPGEAPASAVTARNWLE